MPLQTAEERPFPLGLPTVRSWPRRYPPDGQPGPPATTGAGRRRDRADARAAGGTGEGGPPSCELRGLEKGPASKYGKPATAGERPTVRFRGRPLLQAAERPCVQKASIRGGPPSPVPPDPPLPARSRRLPKPTQTRARSRVSAEGIPAAAKSAPKTLAFFPVPS
jgi:hypothetical protein